MRISDWSSDVCSSDLACKSGRRGQGGQSPIEVVDDVHHSARAGVYRQHIIIMTHPPIGTTSDGEPVTPRIGNHITLRIDRKCVVEGKSVSGRVELGGRRITKKTKKIHER